MPDQRNKTRILLGLIAAAAVLAYLPALQAGFIWDDDYYVENNQTLRSLGGLLQMWIDPYSIPQYYPLVHTTYWLEYRLWGLEPMGYHLVNLLLHLTSCLLLFVVVRRLALPGAALIAALFALHPVMVESVAWVTERKNVLSMVFYLAALLAYLRYAGLDGAAAARGRRSTWWWMIGLFALALTSKSVTFSLPFTCLLICWWKRGRIGVADVLPLLPLILLGAGYGALTSFLEADRVGARGPEWEQSLLERCLIAGRVPWFYLYKLVWPVELTFIYERWQIDAGAAWQYAYPAATLALVGALVWVAARTGRRGPLAAVLMFGGTLFPALGFIDVYPFRYSFVADHFQYHAALGILVLAGAWLTRVVPRPCALPLAVAVLAGYGVRTHLQCQKYENREVLYESILADVPESWFAHNNLAAIYAGREQWDRALEFYSRAHQLRPIIAPQATAVAYAHASLGSIQCQVWSLDPAVRELLALQADVAQMQRLRQQGLPTGALQQRVAERQQAVTRLRDAVLPQVRLAEANLQRAIALSPGYSNPQENLGLLMYRLARLSQEPKESEDYFKRAIRAWSAVVKMQPSSPFRSRLHNLHLEVAGYYDSARRPQDAAAHRATARRLYLEDPDRR